VGKAVLDDAEKQKTINNWLSKKRNDPDFTQPPGSRQH
jgi:hypothetical protein